MKPIEPPNVSGGDRFCMPTSSTSTASTASRCFFSHGELRAHREARVKLFLRLFFPLCFFGVLKSKPLKVKLLAGDLYKVCLVTVAQWNYNNT